ncbi:MAG: DUF3866 family protein [Actinomycetes bacterium]|jgi:hypothetical protein|uniref:Unannotated protein n=1 Tax=freshwater metagenome TaxID=449393 RepID=A0A6J6CII2_9ZZZZ|nr:DUF3866 family protein [Actinomycetota bacterium]
MPSFRTHRVEEILQERPGLQRVRLDDASRAYVLTQLTGDVATGDEVVVNTTAVELGLGTGGWHVVHWNLSRRSLDLPGPGHIMKVRYTSLQADTGAAEEHLPSDAEALGLPRLGGVPVLVGSLHSQLGTCVAVLRSLQPAWRISYVMTDGAALPLALSDLVADLTDRGWITGTVTAGHAFGGALEAVSVPSALQLAVEEQHADVVVVAMGPGVVGTARALGTTAVEVAAVSAAAERLGARPVVVARASEADARPRHRGLSHHTRTSLALTPCAVEVALPPELADHAPSLAPHHVHVVEPGDVADLLDRAGLRVTTMGRGPERDPLSFRTVAAAAVHAASVRPPDQGTV